MARWKQTRPRARQDNPRVTVRWQCRPDYWPDRQELAECNEIGIGLLIEPAATHNELIMEVAEMRDWFAKTREAETQEGKKDLSGGAVRLLALACCDVRHP